MFDNYTTFHKVLDYLELFQSQSPILNTFAYGNLVDFGQQHISGGTVQYPFMFAVPQSIQYDDNITTYQFSLIFADILNWDLTNEKDCVSDMSLEARRFLSYIKRGIQTFPELYNNLDVVLPANAIPFFERFGDHVAGVAMDVQLQVFEDLNACDYYITATPSPTNTSTPTVTPTNTSTPTNTPTETPTNTPTNTSTPTVTPTNTSTPTETPTNTPTETSTQTPTQTPTNTSTPTYTPTETPTQTPTNTQTPTYTPTETPTQTPTPTPTEVITYFILDENGNIITAENGDQIEYEH